MARFIPPRPLDFNGSAGEESVFESLALLPDKYVVFHSLRWVAQHETQKPRRGVGEGDFIILDPTRGILVIEVKGGLIRASGRRWYQTNRRDLQEREIEDPEKQASRTVYFLIDLVSARLRPGDSCRVFHAVWFPSHSFPRSTLPPNYVPEMVFDETTLTDPNQAIEAAFKYWEESYGVSSLSPAAEPRLISILAPEVGAAVSMHWAVDYREQEFLRLTRQQTAILDFLDDQRTATIQGGAGTGKTLVALEKARRLSARGGSVLFLCYNSALRNFLAKHHCVPNVDFHSFHSLASSVLRNSFGSIEALETAFMERLTDPSFVLPYDHVLIDEGQDFPDEWIDALEPAHGDYYVFFDRNQLVQRPRMPEWVDRSECRLTLTRNCRNTVQIARISQRAVMGRVTAENLMPAGPKPVLHACGDEQSMIALAVKRACSWVQENGYAPHDVAVLTMRSAANSFTKLAKIGRWQVAEEITPGLISRNTVRRFKGLEAKAVLLLDVDPDRFDDPTERNLFYVGCSRAMHELEVLFTNVSRRSLGRAIDAMAAGRKIPKTAAGFSRFFNGRWGTEPD